MLDPADRTCKKEVLKMASSRGRQMVALSLKKKMEKKPKKKSNQSNCNSQFGDVDQVLNVSSEHSGSQDQDHLSNNSPDSTIARNGNESLLLNSQNSSPKSNNEPVLPTKEPDQPFELPSRDSIMAFKNLKTSDDLKTDKTEMQIVKVVPSKVPSKVPDTASESGPTCSLGAPQLSEPPSTVNVVAHKKPRMCDDSDTDPTEMQAVEVASKVPDTANGPHSQCSPKREVLRDRTNQCMPVTTLCGFSGFSPLNDLLSEMPLPSPLPDVNRSLLCPSIADEARGLVESTDKNLISKIAQVLSQTNTDNIELKDASSSSSDLAIENLPPLLQGVLEKNPDVFKETGGSKGTCTWIEEESQPESIRMERQEIRNEVEPKLEIESSGSSEEFLPENTGGEPLHAAASLDVTSPDHPRWFSKDSRNVPMPSETSCEQAKKLEYANTSNLKVLIDQDGDKCVKAEQTTNADGQEQVDTKQAAEKERMPQHHVGSVCQMNVVFSGLSKTEKHKVYELGKRFIQCKVSYQVDENTTHVIVKTDENLVCERTLKYFQALSQQIWVISYSWVEASLNCRYLIPVEGFEVQGDTALGKKHGGPERARNANEALMTNYMYEICHLKPFKHYKEGQVKQLVEQCGAKYVQRPEEFSAEEAVTKLILIPASEANLQQDDYDELQRHYGTPVLDVNWLLDSITLYTVQPIEKYHLSLPQSDDESDTNSIKFGEFDKRGRKGIRERRSKPREQNSCDRRKIKIKSQEQDSDIDGINVVKSGTDGSVHASQRTRFPNIKVPRYEKGKKGRRNYNKKHSCYFCNKLIVKVARHMKSQHSDEPEIAKMLSMNKDDQQKELERLRLLGDFEHNLEVYENQKGIYLVLRRSCELKYADDYLPCIHCGGFIEEAEIWRHVKHHCHFKPGEAEVDSDHSIVTQCKMLLEGAKRAYEKEDFGELKATVLASMHNTDGIKEVISKDDLILTLGKLEYERKGRSKKNYIAQKMRQLGRLMQKVATIEDKHMSLDDLINPQHFNVIVKATREIQKPVQQVTMNGVTMTKAPSFGLHVGHALKKCCMLKKGRAIRQKNTQQKSEATEFMELYQLEWTDRISSMALQTLKEKKFFKADVIPLTSDLQKLTKYTSEEIDVQYEQLQDNESPQAWKNLAKAVYVGVTLFNRRRGGEVAKMHVQCVTQRDTTTVNEEILMGLSHLEKKLLSRFDVFHLPGKRNRKVPLIVKREWLPAVELLNAKRAQCGIKKSNPYFFATGMIGHFNAWQTIHTFAVRAGCTNPQDVGTTKIRKYTATVVQLLSLNEGELEWLSNHLGHDINIHKEVYRIHEDTIEVAKIGKLLVAMEDGNIHQYRGKSLQDIGVDDIPIVEDEEEVGKAAGKMDDSSGDEHEVSGALSNVGSGPVSEVSHPHKRRLKRSPIETDSSSDDDMPRKKRLTGNSHTDTSSDEEEIKRRRVRKSATKGNQSKKRTWNDKEESVFKKHLLEYLRRGVNPPTSELKKVVDLLGGQRTLPQVRARANNIIKKKQMFVL